MSTIPSELTNFKEKVSPSIGDMQAATRDLQTKLNDLIKYNNSARDGIDVNYSRSEKAKINAAFEILNQNCQDALSNISGDIGKILCSTL